MKNSLFVFIGLFLIGSVFAFFDQYKGNEFFYKKNDLSTNVVSDEGLGVVVAEKIEEDKPAVSHVATPDVVRAVYVTMWSISLEKKRSDILSIFEKTELNAMIIDFKDSSGDLAFERVDDLKDILEKLHEKNIYLIARIVVFQDNALAEISPEYSLKTKNGNIWRDRRGYAWTDPASGGKGWDFTVDMAKKAIDMGFDEINYDYIRFPTDGNLENIVYPFWDGVEEKSEVIKRFADYSQMKLKEYSPETKLSIDIFGYTFLSGNGLGIGQKLEYLVDSFDYIYPMVYPSHYSTGNFGFSNPAEHPYEVVKGTLEQGLERLGDKKDMARPKIRPWIQVFDLGAVYTPAMIEKQIQATYSVTGTTTTGWLMWSPSNNYHRALGIEL